MPLPDVDPRNTHALLVGVERYAPPFPPLPGAAADALGHARWLIRHQVPADHIRLCVSALDAGPVEEEAARLGIAHVSTASEWVIREALQNDLPGLRGDLLWLTWSGHGLLGEQNDGRLVFPDGRMTLSTRNLRDYLLHNRKLDGIDRKALFLDACRNRLPMGVDCGLVGLHAAAPRARPRTRIVVLYSTQEGSASTGGVHGGLFTRTLLEELDDTRDWPPDPVDLADAVNTALGPGGQQLVHVDNQFWAGPRFRPAPPTHRPPWLRTHDQALTQIHAKRRFLTADLLPYLPPDSGHPASPGSILASLTDTSDSVGYGAPLRGVLLTGPAGAGKTRTSLEVAERALSHDWHVFHPRPDPGLNAEQLVDGVREAVRGDERPVLLVLDYIDVYHGIKIRDLAGLLDAEAEHGLRISCVASVRPGGLKELTDYHSLFTLVDLPSGEERERSLARHIFERVAKKSFAMLGYERMADRCTTKPVMALLLSLEQERLAAARQLDPDASDAPRPGILDDWFQRRTGEEFGQAPGRVELLAATAAALACGHTRDAVERAADTLLRRHAAPFGVTGAWVVARLRTDRWLLTTPGDPDGETLDAFHDIVVDLLLKQTCIPDGYTFAPDVPRQLLDAVCGDTRSLYRAVKHVSRWGGDLNDTHHGELARACAAWLKGGSGTVLDLLRRDSDEGMHTLVSMISATPWRRAVVDQWSTVVAPWLDGADPAGVRTFLTVAALNCGRAPDVLLQAAQDWITRHADDDPDAIHLVNALAHATTGPDGPTDAYEQYVAGAARAWLDRHGTTREGRVRIRTLLRHTGHRPDIAARAAHTAVQLADDLDTELATGRLLTTLHRSKHVPGTDRAQLAKATHGWLAKYGTYERATYVYSAALPSPHLPRVDPIAVFALAWLRCHGEGHNAGFVLKALLDVPDLHLDLVRRAVRYAHAWLADERNGLGPGASFVLAPLLYEHTLARAPERAPDSAQAAVDWLDGHAHLPAAAFVLRNLLKYRDTPTEGPDAAPDPGDITHRTLVATWTWLAANDTWDSILLCAFLARRRDMQKEQALQAVDAVLDRMGTMPRTELDNSFVLRDLLSLHGLRDDQLEDILGHADSWLAAHPEEPQSSFVLAPYIFCAYRNDSADALGSAIDRALRWLDGNGESEVAAHVLVNLRTVRHTATDTRDAPTVERLVSGHLLRWIRACPTHARSTKWLHKTLVRNDELGDEGGQAALDAVRAWLAARDRTPDTADEENRILNRLLVACLGYPGTLPHAVRCARNRVDLDHPGPGDDRVLHELLRHGADDGSPDATLVRAALDWLATYSPNETAHRLLVRLLNLRHAPHDVRLATITHTMNQLRSTHGAGQSAGHVLSTLLTTLRDDPPPHPDVLPVALAWLAGNGQRAGAKHVLHALAGYDQDLARHPEVRTHAENWTAAHPDATEDIQTYLMAYLAPPETG